MITNPRKSIGEVDKNLGFFKNQKQKSPKTIGQASITQECKFLKATSVIIHPKTSLNLHTVMLKLDIINAVV